MRRLMVAVGVVLAGTGSARAQDWVIGSGDPNEVVTLTADRVVDGNVSIINNGRLNVQGATLTVQGDINVLNTGVLDVTNAAIRFVQSFSYQRTLYAADTASLRFIDVVVDTGAPAYAYFVTLMGAASADFQRVTVQGGGATWGLWDSASLVMTDCTRGDEFVPIGTGSLTITGTDGVMFWLTLPDGSTADTTLPPPGTVTSWSVGPDSPWASGINYSASLTNCTNVWWGVMAQSGCDGTFRDSTLRAVGSFFDRSNAVTVQGVANNVLLADTSYAWGDIALRFVNTSVQSWNFYPWGSTNLTLETCVFGELIVSEFGQAWVQSSMCDGSGGYLGVYDYGTLYFVTSANLAQTTSADSATFVAYLSALLGADVNASDNSMMELLDTESVGEPVALEGAVIFDLAVDPIQAASGEVISVQGTARLLTGPTSPFAFQGYTLEYGVGETPTQWVPIGGPFTGEVHDATLASWDTCGILPGEYSVQVSLLHNLGDPATVASSASLTDVQGVGRGTGDFDCDRNVTMGDLGVFVAVLLGIDTDPVNLWIADMNGDGAADGDDIQAFVDLMTSG